MSESQKKKVRQLTNWELNSQEFQHLRRRGLNITKSKLPTEEKELTSGNEEENNATTGEKINCKKRWINVWKKWTDVSVHVVEIIKILAILAAFGAFALSMRQKEFDRFSLVKPLFEVEELDNKSNDSKLRLRLLNHGGIVYFIGCEDNKINKEKLERTPRKYSSLSRKKSVEFLFKNNINKGNSFICYYRDIDVNLYELIIVYKKTSSLDINGFYIDPAPFVYRSDLFVTMSRELLDKIVNCVFPRDWYSEHEELKSRFRDKCPLEELSEIDNCLLVKYDNSDIKDSDESNL